MELYKINNNNIINKDSIFYIKKVIFKSFLSIIIIYSSLKNDINCDIKFITNNVINKENNLFSLNHHIFLNYPNHNSTKLEYINISNLNFNYSFKFKSVLLEYKVGFYDNNKILISPSHLTLYNNLHIICYFKLIKSNISIYSLPNIYKNKYFSCSEIFKVNEKIKLGIKIYIIKENIEYFPINLFIQKKITYKELKYKNDSLFDPLVMIKNYYDLSKNMNNKKINETLKFKKSYLQYPNFILKRHNALNENKWYFKNVFNNYFCFCRGEFCLKFNVSQKCKYYFYLYIIDKNRNLYEKTDYLFVDFIFAELNSDDVFPVFKKMVEQNFQVHYITEKVEIYNEFCYKNKDYLTIIPVNKENYTINGDFLEKYLTLFLKLKAVISGRGQGFNYATNIFYNLEYIIYVGVGHGVSFFKYFLYSEYETYGIKQNDKLLIPPSDKILSIPKRYGWSNDNIIKINLPRWDKYNINENFFNNNNIIKNNSIFIMFTWRDIKKKKSISSYYFKNIINLIENKRLYKELEKNNILLYFTFHHLLNKYINIYKQKYKNDVYINFLDEKDISDCLAKTSLVVSDFSSIIFDIIFRKKPFVIYIPDANDPVIGDIYTTNYYNLIKQMKNGSIEFENKYFDLNETVDKIIYYINNKFKLDIKLEKFYDSFQLKNINSTNEFIYYLINL